MAGGEAEGADAELAIIERLGQWRERRPQKDVARESVQFPMGFVTTSAFAFNMALVWRARPRSACPFCRQLSGRKINKMQTFLAAGDSIKVLGKSPMKFHSTHRHPPIHVGCKCYLDVTND